MGPIGFPELLLIMVLALLLFGPRKLPEIGRSVGKALGQFKQASDDLKRTLNAEIALEEAPTQPAVAPPGTVSPLKPVTGAEPRRSQLARVAAVPAMPPVLSAEDLALADQQALEAAAPHLTEPPLPQADVAWPEAPDETGEARRSPGGAVA
jgi:TatA/E family protein of Tat protein translocase